MSQFSTPVALNPGLSALRSLDWQSAGVVAKAGAGRVNGWHLANKAASARYVKFYNKATAPDQNDTPLFVILLPAGGVSEPSYPGGILFGAGVSVRCTTGVADNDNTAPTANDVTGVVFFT
jgi:hypothetical protein